MSGKAIASGKSAWRRGLTALSIVASFAVAGCGATVEDSYPERRPGRAVDPVGSNKKPEPGLFGTDGLKLFGRSQPEDGAGGGIGVNSFLWRASLDTVSFMPLAQVDPFGGVILTDWFSPPEAPAERVKVNLFILGRQLRADGIRATVFRQTRDANGGWVDAAVDNRTVVDLENAILTRARQLRIDTARP